MTKRGETIRTSDGGVIEQVKDVPPNLAEALLAAQAAMPAVEPDGHNPHFGNRFVTLGKLIAKVRPVLNAHGISVAQFPSHDNGQPTLVTVLMHQTGEQLRFEAPLILTKNDPQGQGSAITYMRRYALASALGISDQDDDDGGGGKVPSKSFERASEADEKAAKRALGSLIGPGRAEDAKAIWDAALANFDGACPEGVASLLMALDEEVPR